MNKPAIRKLEQALSKAGYGAKYTFAELSIIAGVDIKSHRSLINCTNRHLLKHHDRCLLNIREYGYKVVPSDQASSAVIKELNIPPKSYVIKEVSQLDDGKGSQPALLVTYEVSDDPTDVDAAVINHLLSRRKK